jgi:hypothetical protein
VDVAHRRLDARVPGGLLHQGQGMARRPPR